MTGGGSEFKARVTSAEISRSTKGGPGPKASFVARAPPVPVINYFGPAKRLCVNGLGAAASGLETGDKGHYLTTSGGDRGTFTSFSLGRAGVLWVVLHLNIGGSKLPVVGPRAGVRLSIRSPQSTWNGLFCHTRNGRGHGELSGSGRESPAGIFWGFELVQKQEKKGGRSQLAKSQTHHFHRSRTLFQSPRKG